MVWEYEPPALGARNPIQRGSLKNWNSKSQRCEKRLNLNSNLACYENELHYSKKGGYVPAEPYDQVAAFRT